MDEFVVDYRIYFQEGYQAPWVPETSGDSLPSGASIAWPLTEDDGVDFYIMSVTGVHVTGYNNPGDACCSRARWG